MSATEPEVEMGGMWRDLVASAPESSVPRCCHKRCVWPCVEGTTRCEKHTIHHRQEVERRSNARREAGLCPLCGREAEPGKVRCSKHDTCLGAYRCGVCGERGHNRQTCPRGGR